MDFIDYYDVMGLKPSASDDEIKRTYRKLARKYHPDVSKEDDAETKFKELGEAYSVLKDKDKRAEYDELRTYAGSRPGDFSPPPGWQPGRASGEQPGATDWRQQHGSSSADFSEFFREIFGDRSAAGSQQRNGGGAAHGPYDGRSGGARPDTFSVRGEDVETALSISLQDAFAGTSLPLSLSVPTWQADGSVRVDEKVLNVRIPKGVRSGQRIRLRGQGGPGIGEGDAGDLYIELTILPDKQFQLDGRDVTLVLPIMPWEAALGAEVMVPTLGGDVKLRIPERSRGGRKLRLAGRGLPGSPAGHQYVVLRVDFPLPETEEQQALYREMSRLWAHDDPRAAAGE